MNELENLKEIGIKEISRKTHIEPTFLQYIFDKNFEKLSRLKEATPKFYSVSMALILANF